MLDDIRNICHSDEEYFLLVEDLKKFFIRDFYVSQEDRRGINFLFQEDKEGIRLAPLYDYECSFDGMMIQCYQNQIGGILLSSEHIRSILRNDNQFQDLLGLIMSADMSSFMEQVEDKHHIIIEDYYRSLYVNHDQKMKKLLIKNRLV